MTELFTDTVLNMMTYCRAGGLHGRGRSALLQQVPHGERSLLSQRNRRMVGA